MYAYFHDNEHPQRTNQHMVTTVLHRTVYEMWFGGNGALEDELYGQLRQPTEKTSSAYLLLRVHLPFFLLHRDEQKETLSGCCFNE